MSFKKLRKSTIYSPGIDETLDTFFHGKIKVLQRRTGYRFSIDAPLLADFIYTQKNSDCLELGTGNGIVSLLLSVKPFKHLVALEVQKGLSELARRNVGLNGLKERITIVHADLRIYAPDKMFDVIFSNPPYIKKDRGLLSHSEEKSIAKHEIKCSISDIMLRTSELLKPEGRAYFIFPDKRREEFMAEADKNGLTAVSIRFVHPRNDTPANLFLSALALSRSRAESLKELPPLILYDDKGRWSTEADSIFSGRIKNEM